MSTTTRAYDPSERIAALRERAMASPPGRDLSAWRDHLYLEGWSASAGALPARCAEALAHVIETIPVRLHDGDILAGEHGNDHTMVNFRSRPGQDAVEHARRVGLPADLVASMEARLNHEPFRFQELAPIGPWPEELRQAQDRSAVVIWGGDLNHSIRAYSRVLDRGFDGIRDDIQRQLDSVDVVDPDAPHRRANLLAFRRLAEACSAIGARHAAAARQRAEECTGSERNEWLEIAAICDRVPAQPARTFREALQALWFAHMVTVWEDNVNANGIGRIDQMLWPFLEADLLEGRLTVAQAADLLAALWIKLYEAYDVQQMMVGGQTPEGRDAVNPLSYLALDVTEGLGFVRCLSARLHNGSPREFVSRCVDLVARGGGIPFFFNDEALVPALSDRGVSVEDARGYAAIGCIEITIPGKANPHAVSNWINLPRVLEWSLNGGRDPRDGVQVGPVGPTLAECADMDAVMAAFDLQLHHCLRQAVYGSNSSELAHRAQYRLPYLSLLTDDCVARGLDIIEGGARYNYHSSAAMGIPNAADSLAAIRKAVFEDRRVSGEEMLAALQSNFDGADDLRGYLAHRVPKYGNDSADTDEIAADLVRRYCTMLDTFTTPTGGRFFAHLFTFTLMLPMGKATGATPDGRRAGEPIAYSVSPGQGRDVSGLTAVVRSLSRLPHHMVAASSSAILEADPTLLEGPGREAFVDLLMTAVRLGVGQLQFNVVNAETLKAAQADPERYRNLCVRVSGFSQQFGLLDKEMQDHIIARTKHRTG